MGRLSGNPGDLCPQLSTPFGQFYSQLWTNTDLEISLLELVRIKSATLVGCRF